MYVLCVIINFILFHFLYCGHQQKWSHGRHATDRYVDFIVILTVSSEIKPKVCVWFVEFTGNNVVSFCIFLLCRLRLILTVSVLVELLWTNDQNNEHVFCDMYNNFSSDFRYSINELQHSRDCSLVPAFLYAISPSTAIPDSGKIVSEFSTYQLRTINVNLQYSSHYLYT